MSNYPAMLYRDGVLSGDPANQRTVPSAEAELAAAADGFVRWTTKPAGSMAPGVTAADVAASATFAAAAEAKPGDDAEIDAAVEEVRARRRGRR